MACALGSRLGVLGVLFHLLSHQSEEADSIIQDPSLGPGSVPAFLFLHFHSPQGHQNYARKFPTLQMSLTHPAPALHQHLQSCNNSSAQPGHSREKYPQGHTAPRDLACCVPSPLLLRIEHQRPTPYDRVLGAVPDSNPHLALCGPLLFSTSVDLG